ncbi:MAG: aminotransferase class V-fold PLP-dependent enzyme [Thermoplasmataceae archaeon]
MLIPGPVNVPPGVAQASSYVGNHRSQEFRDIIMESESLLNRFAGSYRAVMTTGSGTTAVESMIFSLTSRGDHVGAVTSGEFGNRLIDSLHRRGLQVSTLNLTENDTLSDDDVKDFIGKHREIRSLFLVQNETGNGTSIHDMKRITLAARDMGVRVFVDSVSAFGAVPINVKEWGIDAVATCSQKGLASVPGIGIVLLGEEMVNLMKPGDDIPQYLDLGISLKFLSKNETPYTPSTGGFSALREALKILEREGLEKRWARHHASAEYLRKSLLKNQSEILGNPGNYSDTVIAFRPKLSVKDTIAGLSSKGITVSRGMGKLSDSIIRVGNLGIVTGNDIRRFVNAYYQVSGIDDYSPEEDVPAESIPEPEIMNLF